MKLTVAEGFFSQPLPCAEHRSVGDHPVALSGDALFGAKRLPELGRSVSQGMREFKESVSNHTEDAREAASEIRAEVEGVRQTANGTSADLRKELTPIPLDE